MSTNRIAQLVTIAMVAVACTVANTGTAQEPTPARERAATSPRKVDGAQVDRLKRVFVPLVNAMNHPRSLGQIKVGIADDPHINAASAGSGEFYVTTGLLEKANDEQLAGVLAHELAHDDLGHVAKAQRLGTGLQIGMILLDQIIPGSGNITPLAGALIARKYSRNEEYQADRHGMEILARAGYPKEVMPNTLTWLLQAEGGSGGGFFATHPATADRIQALKKR
jgi:predicted Zn-dependent protease